MKDFYVIIEGIFKEKLTADILECNDMNTLCYVDSCGNEMDRTQFINVYAKSILEEADSVYKELKSELNGRENNGRYTKGNFQAMKLPVENEVIFILYLLCRNMEEVGDMLGVSRQTISKRIKMYQRQR
ncbi:MAG: hypothetical protein IJ326_13405 [Lachnospiraceae bacterium]|nr:hypothetical protein [Lachnospiraceae bacterium]